ncbi:hypothetical protein BGZ99_005148 [Dissophora globulifera]|uniref:N-acetyltransferase domain-containing protein n=1 Tax=Dissophora globulifera TaxID=979702 RepID=A0A9P6RK39_9FUNG|nr:hypothetical protein BGZ99_005148 [Dissophora globulifera]
MITEQTTPNAQQQQHVIAMGPYRVSEDPPHYLSAVDFNDVPEMVRVLNINKDVHNGTATFHYPYLESHAQARIARAMSNRTDKGYNSHWAMRISPDGPIMGWIHAYFNPTVQEFHPVTGRPLVIADMGYWVSPEYVGKGYASRSTRFVVHEILFKEFECDIVRSEAYPHNVGSRKAMQAAGMEQEYESKTVFIPKFQENRIVCGYAVHRDESTKIVVSNPDS